jgi:H+/Cl- antiporter ClcA
MHKFLRPPYIYLILGIISFSGAVVSTCTGKTWARFRGSVYRTKEPNAFWRVVAVYFLGAVLFIGLFLYEVT